MKQTLCALIAIVLLTGCVRYDVTLNNGSKFTNVSKPKLDKERQMYIISGGGKRTEVKASRVTVIEPHQEEQFKSKNDSMFLPAR
jgi:hypothetical protein